MNNTTNRGANRPQKHYRFGSVRISLWRDERKGPTGQSFDSWSVTIDRSYKDAKGAWQNTGSLRENDIPKAISALTKAYAYIMEKGSEDEDGVQEETVR